MGTEIRGWRVWQLQDKRLTSVTVDSVVYEPRQATRAECMFPLGSYLPVLRRTGATFHRAPSERCTCGVYAMRSLERLLREFRVSDAGSNLVVGEIKLWGRVIVSAAGFRAEFGYPSQLYVRDPAAQQLLGVYGVPVVVAASLFGWKARQVVEALPTATPEMLEHFRPLRGNILKEVEHRIQGHRGRIKALEAEIDRCENWIAVLKQALS